MSLIDAKPSIIRRSLHDEIIDLIREMITSGELEPGEKVPEKDLCERFGVSRTPLREALKVLAVEGLVTLTPNRGAFVSVLTLEDLVDAFPVMGALEALSGELAAARMTDEEIAAVRHAHEAMVVHYEKRERAQYFRLNQQIHEAILMGSRNQTLIATYRALAGRVRRARYLANMSEPRWRQAVEEHEVILARLEDRDAKALAEVLKEHLANKFETVKAWVLARDG